MIGKARRGMGLLINECRPGRAFLASPDSFHYRRRDFARRDVLERKAFSSKCGMLRIKNVNKYESLLWNVLVKEHLADLSQFHRSGFVDEVPLFSRDSDIDFLKEDTAERANRTLLGFALKFLKSVVSYQEHRSPYFAAITIWSPAHADRLVPNLFVWSGSVHQLRKKLILDVVKTSFAKKINRIVSAKNPEKGFELLEDTSTDPRDTRVFISFSQPPYQSFVPLGQFRRPEAHVK